MYPTVGRIVNYYGEAQVAPPLEPLAAMIVKVSGLPDVHSHKHSCTEQCVVVDLCVFTQAALTQLQMSVPWSSVPARTRCWCWPQKSS